MAKYLDWHEVFSRQTGTNAEFVIVDGAKNIGKTFGLRLELIKRCIKKGTRYVEFSRSKDERDRMQGGYFDKIQAEGYYKEYRFKTEKDIGFWGMPSIDDDGNETVEKWHPLLYFVSLSTFQQEKKRTYAYVRYFMLDEAIIDRRDKRHRYLNQEFSILANLIDTILREQYDKPSGAKVFLLGNSCDLLCPYIQALGVKSAPPYGFSWHNSKHTLYWHIEPWAIDERKVNTLVGRMLADSAESDMIFANEYSSNLEFVKPKPPHAQFRFGLVFNGDKFGIWLDRKEAYFHITEKIPANSKSVYALTKRDSTIDYGMLRKTDDLVKLLISAYCDRCCRFESPAAYEKFLELLSYFGLF